MLPRRFACMSCNSSDWCIVLRKSLCACSMSCATVSSCSDVMTDACFAAMQHTTGSTKGGGYETHQHHRDSFTTKSYVQGNWTESNMWTPTVCHQSNAWGSQLMYRQSTGNASHSFLCHSSHRPDPHFALPCQWCLQTLLRLIQICYFHNGAELGVGRACNSTEII